MVFHQNYLAQILHGCNCFLTIQTTEPSNMMLEPLRLAVLLLTTLSMSIFTSFGSCPTGLKIFSIVSNEVTMISF